MQVNLIMIKKEADFSGLLFLSNGATISIITLLNILVFSKNICVVVLELVDFSSSLRRWWLKNLSFHT